jgi:C4-dicarboxylate-specific signal transduction histidine kinase
VASSALFALQYFLFQRDYKRGITAMAQIIEGVSAPTISLGAPETTQDFLNALAEKPRIVGAVIYINDGSVVAEYGRVQELKRSPAMQDGFQSRDGELLYVYPLMDDGQRVGTLRLISDYRSQSMKLHGLYASILVAVLASSFLVAVIVSSRLERVICGPIQSLADTARRVTSHSDYSIRAKKEADDEVGEFTDAFNSMLKQIEKREADLEHEIAERTRAEQELQRMQEQLMDASRQAGMAEVATGVLHNVGNVLNSVNVSATLIAERLNSPRIEKLGRAAELLRAKAPEIERFLKDDPKGRLLPNYLAEAAQDLSKEQRSSVEEMELLVRNIEHIKDIVARQQSYARVSGVVEAISLEELIEDALQINAGAFERHRVTVIRGYENVPPAAIDKHKVLQILVNLIRNAKYAISDSTSNDRRLTVRLRRKDDRFAAIDVIDSGVGISPENLTRIFSHGFTTRKDGHGFGLHSSAIAAIQMGGRLSVQSEGLGRGATFILELPFANANADAASVPAKTTEPQLVAMSA